MTGERHTSIDEQRYGVTISPKAWKWTNTATHASSIVRYARFHRFEPFSTRWAPPNYGSGRNGALVRLTLSLRNAGAQPLRVSPALRIIGFTRHKRAKHSFAYDVRPAQFPSGGVLAPGELVELSVRPPACAATAGIDRIAVTLVVRAAMTRGVPTVFDVMTNRFDVPTIHEHPESPAVAAFRVVCRP